MLRMIVLLSLILVGCERSVQVQVKIVDTYRTGIAFRKVITVVELKDGSRHQLRGKLGKKGETVNLWIREGRLHRGR